MIQQTSRRIGRACAAMIVCLLTAAASIAQAGSAGSPQWSAEFAAPTTNGQILAHAVFNDGTGPALYCGGSFTEIGGVFARGLAKWNGVTWSEVGGGVGGGGYYASYTVKSLEVFTFGATTHLYVGGSFSSVGTGTSLLSVNSIARWSGVAWSALGTGLIGPYNYAGEARAMAVHNAGSGNALYVGGAFDTAGGIVSTNIARWTGSAWQAVGGGLNGPVNDLEIYTTALGTHIYAAGSFYNSGINIPNAVARFTGSAWAALAAGLNNPVSCMAVHDDGTGPALYVAAGNHPYGPGAPFYVGNASGFAARWDGSAWSLAGSSPAGINYMKSFHDASGTTLWATGSFTFVAGVPSTSMARFDGLSWTDGSYGASVGGSLASYNDGSGSQLWCGMKRLVSGQWIAPGSGILSNSSPTVAALRSIDTGAGEVIAATGSFGVSASQTGGVTYDRTAWSKLGASNLYPNVSYPYSVGGRAIAHGDIGGGAKLYLGGDYTVSGPGFNYASGVLEIDGENVVPLSGLTGVRALAIYDDGSGPALYAGGAFNLSSLYGYGLVAKWTGSSWLPVGGGLFASGSTAVDAMIVHDDGSGPKLYVGGTFTNSQSGVSLGNIACWDGTAWSSVGNGVSGGSVQAFTEYAASGPPRLIIGGSFTHTGTTPRAALAAWDGAAYSDLGVVAGSNSSVKALTVHDDGLGVRLYAGGSFPSIGASSQPALAKWDGTSWSNVGGPLTGFPGWDPYLQVFYAVPPVVAALASSQLGGPSLYVGGQFALAGGFASANIARLARPGPMLFGPPTAIVGETIVYELNTPSPFMPYVLDATLAGASPGVPIGGGLVIPMNPPWLNLQFGNLLPGAFTNAFGVSDGFGSASAMVTLPAFPFLAGLTLTASYATLDPFGPFGVGAIAPPRATTFVPAEPTPVSVTPPFGSSAGGRPVVVYGAGFTTGSTVRFDGVAATAVVVAADGNSLTCLTSAGATGDAVVRVVGANGAWGQATGLYTYTPPLSVASIVPASAPAGTLTVVSGDGFQPGATVVCGGVPATNVVVDMNSTPNTLTFARPSGVVCGGVSTVSLPDGQSTSAAYNPVPTALLYFNGSGPASGGGQFFIVGSGFLPGTTVSVGGAPATLLSTTTTVLLCAAPSGVVGNAPITVTSPGGCAAANVGTYIYY